MRPETILSLTRKTGSALWIVMAMAVAAAQNTPPAQTAFESPQKAVEALLAAAEQSDAAALEKLFGPDGKDLISSGDPVQDKNHMAAFASNARLENAVAVDPKNANRAVLSTGENDWPFSIPIVNRGGIWYFDSKAGRDEIVFRRIGSNELNAIQVCPGYVEAQPEYSALACEYTGTPQYAQRLISTPCRKDGLYWRNADGSPGGPISEAVARAIDGGYSPDAGSAYHGYHFKGLKGQGPAAPMGELDYLIKGIMIGGFTLIAAPAEYGVSGVKTLMVGPDGIVHEKDLGPGALNLAKGMEKYNPDKTWRRSDDEWPQDALR